MMCGEIRVVVGIATHSRARELRKALGSALAQSFHSLRITVIDDASNDDTPEVRLEFPAVQWERWDQNKGQVQARNAMMLNAPEEYYVSLDDDAWFLSGDEIAVAIDYLESHQHVAVVAFDILTADRPDIRRRGKVEKVALFIGCGHVARLSAVKELGGYHLLPGIYGAEETDLSLRLIDGGHDLVLLQGVHVWHDKTPTARDLPRQHRSGVRNDMVLTVWRYPAAIVLPALAWKLLRHLCFGIQRTALLSATLAGLWDFFTVSSRAWLERTPVRLKSITRYHRLARSPEENAA